MKAALATLLAATAAVTTVALLARGRPQRMRAARSAGPAETGNGRPPRGERRSDTFAPGTEAVAPDTESANAAERLQSTREWGAYEGIARNVPAGPQEARMFPTGGTRDPSRAGEDADDVQPGLPDQLRGA